MRRLTAREKFLIVLLLLLLVAGLYYLFFYMPLTEEISYLQEENEQVQSDIVVAETMVAKKKQMEAELERIIAAAGGNPTQIAEFDNSNTVINELHAILAVADSYSLSFSSATAEDNIVRRSVQMQYVCGTYANAKAILMQLHDSPYRCLLNTVSISTGSRNKTDGSSYSVTAQVIYFEYLK